MKLKKLISISLVLAMLMSMLPQYALAAPDETDVLLSQLSPQYGHNSRFLAPIDEYTQTGTAISNRQDLINIATNSTTMDGTYYLTADIDLSASDWSPLGDSNNPFTGSIDGRGYEIKFTVNLTPNFNHITSNTFTTPDTAYAGLFAHVGDGAEFKNLGLDANINLKIMTVSELDVANLSAPGGSGNYGITINLYSRIYAGGFFARSSGNVNISNCYNRGAISLTSDLSTTIHATSTPASMSGSAGHYTQYSAHSYAYAYAGGIYGYSDSGEIDISDCYNAGAVEANFELKATAKHGYPILNTNTSAYTYAYNNAYIGGIYGFGNADTSITNCYNEGAVTSNMNSTFIREYFDSNGNKQSDAYGTNYHELFSGGLLGYSPGGSVDISNCFNSGDIGSYTTAIISSSDIYPSSGGIMGTGSKYIDISNSYNTGNITGYHAGGIYGHSRSSANVKSSCNSGTILGGYAAGGIYGYSYSSAANTIRSYNTGNVSAQYAGGICGYTSSSAAITDCYNNGSITATSYAGGIIGRNNGADAGSGSVSVTISECYNAGTVTNTSTSNNNAGGICGYNSGSLPADIMESCYWLDSSVTTGVGVSSGTDNTKSLTDADMKLQTSFGGFNFFNVWIIEDTENNGYPYLRASTTNLGIQYQDPLDDIIVPGWIDGKVLVGSPPAAINLQVEQLILYIDFIIASYSVDGGVTWKKVRNQFDANKFPKLLDKGMTLHIANTPLDKKTKEPALDENGAKPTVIIFQKINKRPETPKSHIRLASATLSLAPDFEAGADPTGSTLGTWLLSGVHGSRTDTVFVPIATTSYIQVGVAEKNKKNVDSRGYGTFYVDDQGRPKGVPVEAYNGKVARTSYYIRVAPSYSGGNFTAASKAKRIYAKGASKAPKYKIKRDGTVKIKSGTYVKIGSRAPVLYRESTTVDVGLTETVEIWKAATSKKAASEKQIILPTIR